VNPMMFSRLRIASPSRDLARRASTRLGTSGDDRASRARPTFIATVGRTLAAVAFAGMLVGCEVDSWMDPSRTGYFETTPTTMPILARLDVIERDGTRGAQVSPPLADDLVPIELKYRLSPGDEVRVEVWELIEAGRTEVLDRIVDQTGNLRIKEIGDVAAAGLTIEEVQREIEAKVARLVMSPIVGVSLLRGQGFQFSISGAVQTVGVFGLNRPDFRLSEAVALAGGTFATTQRITVIRAAPLDDTLNPVYPAAEAGLSTPATGGSGSRGFPALPPSGGERTPPATGAKPAVDINDLIDQLDAKAREPQAAPTEPSTEAPSTEEPSTGASSTDAPVPTPTVAPLAPGMIAGTASRGPRVLPRDEPPAIDIDDVSTPMVQDSIVVPVPATSGQAVGAGGWVFDVESGRWMRGGAPGVVPSAAAQQTPAAKSMYTTRIIEVDYQALIRGDQDLNIVIRPGDQIYVEPPETGFVYIDGEVNRPGVYEIQNSNGRLTLSRFVSAAGGLAPTAIPNRVDLVRVVGKDREATIRVDLAAIRNRSEPDIYMRPDDHVIIGTNLIATPLAVIRNGFRMTYGFGFLLDRNFGNDVFGPPPESSFFN
jgi:polysaccharide biosynthesis/export protein